MHSSIYLLIVISVLAGFFARPLNMFVFGGIVSLVKYLRSKPLIILLMLSAMLTTMAVTLSTIYLCLKFAGFIPLAEHTPAFVVSFLIGGALWVIYAKLFNHQCRIDLD